MYKIKKGEAKRPTGGGCYENIMRESSGQAHANRGVAAGTGATLKLAKKQGEKGGTGPQRK